MIKLRKIINITLIYTILLGGGPAYSADVSHLRAPLLFGDKKTIHARDVDINKPVSSMSFEELVWWYKALLVNEYILSQLKYSLAYAVKHDIIGLDFKKSLEEVEKLLEYHPLKDYPSDKKIMNAYFLWFMRVSTKEITIPLSMYPDRNTIRKKIEDLIITADKEERLDPDNADKIKKRCLVEIMVILEEFYEKKGRALFEKAYRERKSDEKWPDYALEGGVASVLYLYPRDLINTPSLLTRESL